MNNVECARCGRKATDKNIRSFVQSAWDEAQTWSCDAIVPCKARAERRSNRKVTK